jgi:hypothetical protein
MEFPMPGHPDGARARVGFRPYAVQVSPDLAQYRHRGVLRHTFFLGVMLRLELELPSGLILRARMTKEEYAQLGLADDREVSLQVRSYRTLGAESAPLAAELPLPSMPPPTLGENI